MTTEDADLTPAERAAFAALPHERAPGRLLEERVVRALRTRGVLRRRAPAPAWIAAGLAASVALFAGGFAAGQSAMSRRVTDSLLAAQATTARQAAEAVQRTGTAYIAALAALSHYADSAGNGAVQQGQQAAWAALSAAAAELAALDPNDPIARSVQTILTVSEQPVVERSRARAVLWF
jgi:hypothetical protein